MRQNDQAALIMDLRNNFVGRTGMHFLLQEDTDDVAFFRFEFSGERDESRIAMRELADITRTSDGFMVGYDQHIYPMLARGGKNSCGREQRVHRAARMDME